MNKVYVKVKQAKEIVAEIISRNEYTDEAIRELISYAWNIRHSDYALFRAIDAVFETATITEDLRWGYNFYMPTTEDACRWMRRFGRKIARKDEQYRKYIKEAGI